MTPWALISPARLAGSGLLKTQSDARLVDLVRAGNDRAFEAIVIRYHRPLLRHCRRLLPAARAEDAVQQAFLHALEAIRSDGRELQLAPWLHRIAHNTAIDALRLRDSDWKELDEQIDGVEPPDTVLDRRARFRSVVAALGSLPERQRRALVLRELEGRSYEEIAATLGVSGAGVRQLLNRARNAMRAGASALIPAELVGRLANSQAGVRAAELVDPPGTSALVLKGTAAVAAGAALLAVTASPPADRGRLPHADASAEPPALQARADARRRSGGGATADRERRRSAMPDRGGQAAGGHGGGPGRGRSASGRNAAGSDGADSGQRVDRGGAPQRRSGSDGAGEDNARGGFHGGSADDDFAGRGDDTAAGDDEGLDDDVRVPETGAPDDDDAADDDDTIAPTGRQTVESPAGRGEADDDDDDHALD